MSDEPPAPPRDFSLLPFWFWNDELSESELLRQIEDFDARGVYGFVIHPRVGLPRSIGWMSDAMLRFMAVAIAEARRRDMKVLLYDEGMYPSGSSSGQVVAANPDLACRCLAMLEVGDGQRPRLAPGQNLVADLRTASGRRVAIVDRKVDAYIRGLHYIDGGPREDEPPAGDILNPETTREVIRLVYDRFHEHFGADFGRTILGVFTDEPNPLGKCRERHVRPGTSGILAHVSRFLGYDFTPHLAALWFDDEPDAKRHRADYERAIRRRMEETWYAPLSAWCESKGVALCGHPDRGDEMGAQRYFHIPGQDLVWRWVEPDQPTALEGPESTQAKCSSSAMLHLGRRRNSNEFGGAYGPQTTFAEMKWLADWCLVRGVNLLIPHAFYYSIRGPRKDERPPQLGPHTPAWDDGRFKAFADHCRRLCWLNTDSQHVCDVAILTDPDHCAWRAAKVCYEHQRDFNYLDPETLLSSAHVNADGVRIAGMHYRAMIVDGLPEMSPILRERLRPLSDAGRLAMFDHGAGDGDGVLAMIDRCCPADVRLDPPSPDVRVRHVIKAERHYYLLFNERGGTVATTAVLGALGTAAWIDSTTGRRTPIERPIRIELDPFDQKLLEVN